MTDAASSSRSISDDIADRLCNPGRYAIGGGRNGVNVDWRYWLHKQRHGKDESGSRLACERVEDLAGCHKAPRVIYGSN